jgi:hypothetical protein
MIKDKNKIKFSNNKKHCILFQKKLEVNGHVQMLSEQKLILSFLLLAGKIILT